MGDKFEEGAPMILVPRFYGFVRVFVIICAITFFILSFLRVSAPPYYFYANQWFGLLPELLFRGMIHQVATWIFLHGNLTHLLFNMLGFWMFGSLLQDVWGQRRFIRFVFISGILTGIIVGLSGFLDPIAYGIPTIGASGVVFAILMAVSRLFPDQIVLVFFIFPMKMRYFAYLMIAMEFFALWSSNQHGVSNIAHLGGAFVGYFYVSTGRGGRGSGRTENWFKTFLDRWHQRKMRKRIRLIRVNEYPRYHFEGGS